MGLVNMHIHSSYSDGIYSPMEILNLLEKTNLSGFALTDHDTFDGIEYMQKCIKETNSSLFFIPGCEISTYFGPLGDIHILAYFADNNYKKFLPVLNDMHLYRKNRAKDIIDNLNNAGYSLDFDKISGNKKISLGRMHIARELVNQGYFDNTDKAFETLLRKGCPFYIPNKLFNTIEVIGEIYGNGGIAALAHPTFLQDEENWKYIDNFVKNGLSAIECFHPKISKKLSRKIRREFRYKLNFVGGSDFHDNRDFYNLAKFGIDLKEAKELVKYFYVS